MESFLLQVSGARLYIESVGDKNAAPVVFLHGGPGAGARYLRPQCDALLDEPGMAARRLIYYDQRGCERSPLDAEVAPGGYEVQVADLEAVRTWLGVPKLMLCGYSWGGLLAMLYALAHPDRLERLALISPAPASSGGRDVYQQRLSEAAKRPDVMALRRELLEQSPPPAAETQRRYRFALAVAGYFVNPRRALELSPFRIPQRVEQAIWSSLGDYDLRPRLPTLRHIPTLIAHGENDVIPIATARETAALLGARLVELSNCGHVPYIEAAAPLFSALGGFLDASRA